MNKKIIVYLLVVIIFAAAAVVVKVKFFREIQQPPQKFYTIQYDVGSVDLGKIPGLDPSAAQKYKNKFIEYQGKLEAAVKEYEESGKAESKKPNPDYFIEKARFAEYLGQSDWAIETLNELFVYYENSSVAWNNLAKIYEEKKDYAKANGYYQKTIDTFGEKEMWGNYYYMIRNHMLAGNKEKALEYYEKYLKLGGAKDGEFEEYLK